MKLNIGQMTKEEDTKLYALRRDGYKRYSLSYVPEGLDYEHPFFEANKFEDIMNKLAEHYQQMIADDVSEITNINTGAFYRIDDFCANGERIGDCAYLEIGVSDLNKISLLLPLLGYSKKTTKRTTKKAESKDTQE